MDGLPPPNLHGDYVGSCIVCMGGTDTALVFIGDRYFRAWALFSLGMSEENAINAVEQWLPEKMPVKVCAECVSKAKADFPAPGIPSLGGIPHVSQGPESRSRTAEYEG